MKPPFFDLNLPFGGQVAESLCFRSERGDHCAQLLPAWDALFPDFNLLGPVFIIMPSPFAVLARFSAQTEFSKSLSELIDTRNDLFLDPAQIGMGLLVEETGSPGQKRVGFQFFDHAGQGLLKILLTNQSNLNWFGNMVDYYVTPPVSDPSRPTLLPAPPKLPGKLESPHDLGLLWPFFLRHPSAQHLAGTGLSRWEAATQVDSAFSRETPSRLLGSILRLAKRDGLSLQLQLANQGHSFQHAMQFQRLENDGESWHAFGASGDMHFYPTPHHRFRISCYPANDGPHHFLECFSSEGTFLGSLGCSPRRQADPNHSALWNHWLSHLANR